MRPTPPTSAVAVELKELIGDHLDVIQGAGALGVAGHLDLLGRGQRGKDLTAPAGGQGFELQQLLADIHLGIAGQLADLLDLLLELHQGLFKLEQGASGHRELAQGKQGGQRQLKPSPGQEPVTAGPQGPGP
jgi:hypothetical protein